jgi:RNA recognition motif-containing protein
MGAQLYVGNLDHSTTEDTLRRHLAGDGRTVKSLEIKTDKSSGRSRGFAFAELGSEDEVQAAITSLNGIELDGRPLKVNHGHVRPIYSGSTRSQSDFGGGFRRDGGGRR